MTAPPKDPSFHDLMQQSETNKSMHSEPTSASTSKTPSDYPSSHSFSLDRQTILNRYYRPPPPPESHKKSGVQVREFMRLKQGKIPPTSQIDFHNHTLVETIPKLENFIATSSRQHHRCVLIICGRGKHSQDGLPKLSHIIKAWLFKSPLILAYCCAKTHHGGSGALYTLIKKAKSPIFKPQR